MLLVRSAAKVNLSLDVLSRRADGYHELQSIVHSVGLWDSITLRRDAEFSLSCNVAELQTDDNLCLKAGRLWREHASKQNAQIGAARLRLDKRIPFGAGLGGGSGNAAAVLVGLNRLYDVSMAPEVLCGLAAQLGADVPFFLQGGCALMEGIGEKLTPLRAISGWLVLLQPSQTLSTPQIFRRWDSLGRTSAHSTSALQSTLNRANDAGLTAIGTWLHNDLRHAAQQEGVDVAAMCALLRRAGALGAEMSGSGSAVFGLFAGEDAAHQAAAEIRSAEIRGNDGEISGLRVWAAPFSSSGLQVAVHGNIG